MPSSSILASTGAFGVVAAGVLATIEGAVLSSDTLMPLGLVVTVSGLAIGLTLRIGREQRRIETLIDDKHSQAMDAISDVGKKVDKVLAEMPHFTSDLEAVKKASDEHGREINNIKVEAARTGRR